MLTSLVQKIKRNPESVLMILLLLVSGIIHGYNMFGFPYYENDEGVYLSQAWSVLTEGKLAPYTYWYDHAPAGWILISIWLFVTKSLFAFNISVNSGRVFMLLIHIVATYLVARVGKKLTGNVYAGILAGLIFSLTPLGLYFQRRILLDSIMIFWVLAAFVLVIQKGQKLSTYMMSAVFFGIAILTKENALFFIPGFLVTIYQNAHTNHKIFALSKWILVMGLVVSLYFMYALINNEFFPSGTLLGGDDPHVSLLETLKFQYTREGGSYAGISSNLALWVARDPFIIKAGIISNSIVLLLSLFFRQKRNYMGLGLLGAFFWLFLSRGGIVIEFYIVPLIPLMSLFIGIALYELVALISRILPRIKLDALLASLCVFILLYYFLSSRSNQAFGDNDVFHLMFKSDQTLSQKDAIDWMRKSIDPDSVVIIDNHSYLDLRESMNPSGIVFPKAHWYWKVNQDPMVKLDVLQNDSQNIDYIFATPQMYGDLMMGTSSLTTAAMNNALQVKSFDVDGWSVDVWATRYPAQVLSRSWKYYKDTFIVNGDYTVDPANGYTTSEGQSYALLRAVWMDDKDTFDRVWNWTCNHLQNDSGTFGWRQINDGTSILFDSSSATDADTDIALALLFAHKRWDDDSYLQSAQKVLSGIWNTEVKQFEGAHYIVPGNWAKNKDNVIVNPSYLSPYAYRIFAEADPTRPWIDLVDSSYYLIEGCMRSNLVAGQPSANLPPNWCALNVGRSFSQNTEEGLASTEYSYDAIRTMWRLAVDHAWFDEPRAKALLHLSGDTLEEKWKEDGKILVGYSHNGDPWEKYDSVLGYSTNLANFAVTNRELANTIYSTKVLEKYYEDFDNALHYWEDPNNYYTQNWAWFGTALYADQLPNLWK